MKNTLLLLVTILTTAILVPHELQAQKEKHRFGTPVKKAKVAEKNSWAMLGKKEVDLKLEKDEVFVEAYEGSFTALKLVINNAPVHVKSMTVVFMNGEKETINVDHKFSEGSTSKLFDLPGNKRAIKKIKLIYKTIGEDDEKAKVQVWGKH